MICGVLEASNEGAEVGGFTDRGQINALISGRRDARQVWAFCRSDGIPGSQRSYCSCVIWQAERDAQAAGRTGPGALRDEEATRQA